MNEITATALVLTTGIAFLAFAVPTLLHGSGFLAVYPPNRPFVQLLFGRGEDE